MVLLIVLGAAVSVVVMIAHSTREPNLFIFGLIERVCGEMGCKGDAVKTTYTKEGRNM
jgi:hypothetical protein